MPNTLAHIGVQPLLTRPLLPKMAARWLLLGCMLPDLPWIGQRLVRPLLPDGAGHTLRAWVTVQGSLAFCLLLAGAFAMLSRRPPAVFLALAWGSLLHLLLDALQVKPGGGVLLLAPAAWRPLGFDLFWPESWPTAVLTAAGAVAAIWLLRHPGPPAPAAQAGRDSSLSPRRLALALLLAGAWLAGPWLLLDAAIGGNSHGLAVLRPGAARGGRTIAFDREHWDPEAGGLRIYTGETLRLTGAPLPAHPARISLTGTFQDQRTVRVAALHVHPRGWRDGASLLGLGVVAWCWLPAVPLRRGRP